METPGTPARGWQADTEKVTVRRLSPASQASLDSRFFSLFCPQHASSEANTQSRVSLRRKTSSNVSSRQWKNLYQAVITMEMMLVSPWVLIIQQYLNHHINIYAQWKFVRRHQILIRVFLQIVKSSCSFVPSSDWFWLNIKRWEFKWLGTIWEASLCCSSQHYNYVSQDLNSITPSSQLPMIIILWSVLTKPTHRKWFVQVFIYRLRVTTFHSRLVKLLFVLHWSHFIHQLMHLTKLSEILF